MWGCTDPAAGYTIVAVDAWTFIWLMVFLKIPIVAPVPDRALGGRARRPRARPGEDGGIGPRPRPCIRITRAPGCRARRAEGPTASRPSARPRAFAQRASRQRLPRG